MVEGSTIEDWEVGIRASEDLMVLRGNTFDNQIDVNVDKETLPRLLAVDNDFGPRRIANVRFEDVDREHLHVEDLLWPDWSEGVVLDGGLAYYDQQAPEYVPVPTTNALEQLVERGSDRWREIRDRLGAEPTELVGRTNAELSESFGVAAYGRVMPDSAGPSHLVAGGQLADAAESTVWLDAASGDVGDIFQHGADASASNGRYISVRGAQRTDEPPTNRGIATYTFETDAGTYEIFGRVWARDGDSFWLRVDGVKWIPWDHLRSYRGWRWHAVPAPGEDSEGPRQFELGGGTHTIEIGYRGNRVRLDSLLVTADGIPPIGRGLVPPPAEQ